MLCYNLHVHLMEISLMQKNLPRKKRRKLEAAREMLEDEEQDHKPVKVSAPYLLTFSKYG